MEINKSLYKQVAISFTSYQEMKEDLPTNLDKAWKNNTAILKAITLTTKLLKYYCLSDPHMSIQ